MNYLQFFEDLKSSCPQELGVTDAFVVDQVQNDLFSILVDDRRPAYNRMAVGPDVEPEPTEVNPMFLLALHAMKSKELGVPVLTTEDFTTFNYGYDSVTWSAPVPVGAEVRARVTVREVVEPRPRHFRAKVRVAYEVAGLAEPAIVADTVLYCLSPDDVDDLRSGHAQSAGDDTA